MGSKVHSRSDEYIKRYGKRYCYEWFMRASLDRCYRVLLKSIKYIRTKARKDMAILVPINSKHGRQPDYFLSAS